MWPKLLDSVLKINDSRCSIRLLSAGQNKLLGCDTAEVVDNIEFFTVIVTSS
jgi:hypothetical protein